MNRNDDFDQTLGAWLRDEAPPEAPDRVLQTALRRVADLPQRRQWFDPTKKGTTMGLILRTTAMAAVLVLAAVIGLRVASLAPSAGGPSPSVPGVLTPSPSATSSATPTRSLPADCVNAPDIAALSLLKDPVACYGDTPLTLDAHPVAAAVDCPVTVEPTWLACPPNYLMLIGETRKVGAPFLMAAVDPSSGISLSSHLNSNVRVTGHYDDPAAQTCRETGRSAGVGGTPEPLASTIERCRRTFVVTEVLPLQP